MENIVIAIDPGTRYWGVTVFQGKDIIISMVKTFSTKGSVKDRTKASKMALLNLFDKYILDILVIEKPFFFWSKQSRFLNKIIEEVKKSAKKQGMKVFEYSSRTARKAVCNDGKAGKKDAAKIICSIYPELKGYLNQDRRYKESYWEPMFDSVSLGICYLRKKYS
jgi:Holliday junction resolvasome RuvABC endonuclease subunit